MTSTRDHIEKTFADAYRKEIDQEENVWRSLPFFAAAIAFEFTTLAQAMLRMPDKTTGAWWDVTFAIIVIALCLTVAIAFLVISIMPADFVYVSEEPALLDYARGLDQDEADAAAQNLPAIDALAELKDTLAEQYAEATADNRKINQARAYRRSVAGLAVLASIGFTVLLVIRLLLYNVPH